MRDSAKRLFKQAQARIARRRKKLEAEKAEVLDKVVDEALERLRQSGTDEDRDKNSGSLDAPSAELRALKNSASSTPGR